MTTNQPLADRVKETSTTTGTGTLTLNGATTGFQAFSTAFTTGTRVYYCISDGTDWEVGAGVYTTAGTTLSRAKVLASSNAGALVNFGAGSKEVFNTKPAAYLDTIDNTGATSDLVLGIGQSAKSSFTAATSMPLHIACGDGQIYELKIVGSYTLAAASTPSYLQPNNAVPATNNFGVRQLWATSTTTGGAGVGAADGGFRLEGGGASILESTATLFTSTANKKAIVHTGNSTSTVSYFFSIAVEWVDTTTVWSSLGTVIVPNAETCVITVTRIA